MRLVFAGTPVFAQRALAALAQAGHDVALVLTRPDKPAQRGRQLLASPVKQWALEQGLEVWQPPTLRDPGTWARLREVGADVMVVAAYGLILPVEVLAIPAHGCLNIHASLLPRWRGAAPIQRAVQAGDDRTGITIMQMDAGLDTGPMRLVRECPIGPEDTGSTVHDALAEAGAQAIVEALERLAQGSLPLLPQPSEGVTYAQKLTKADAPIDWHASSRSIVDRIRAFDPVPGSTASLERAPDTVLKVWKARAAARPDAAAEAPAGTVLAVDGGALTVACGERDAVALLELQRPGGRRLPAREFLAGFPVSAGERFCGVSR
ncbi:MAG: methionyl-tRNA formyltransferase [Burkholderiales bacterium]|nr:MAG: methionyl-tRNA formyltransferase [Burkholderiales bacterium]